jgi:hypothetical protein
MSRNSRTIMGRGLCGCVLGRRWTTLTLIIAAEVLLIAAHACPSSVAGA